LKQIPGVVETGLFLRLATKVVVAGERGIEVRER
jgi:ribose 5-phosphate isomerase